MGSSGRKLVDSGGLIRVNGPAGTFRQIQFGSGPDEEDIRWSIQAKSTAEAGGNAGSDLEIVRWSDDGTALDAPVAIERSSGAVSLGGTAFAAVSAGSWRATDHGLVAWSFDPAMMQGGTILPTAGLLQVVRVRALSSVATSIEMYVTAGGTSLTSGQCFAALFNSAGALLGAGAVTASAHGTGAAGWGDAGAKTLPLTVAQGVTRYADYLVGFYANTAGTLPTFARAANVSHGAALNMGMSAPTFRFSSADSGLTTAMPANVGAQTAIGTAWLVGIK